MVAGVDTGRAMCHCGFESLLLFVMGLKHGTEKECDSLSVQKCPQVLGRQPAPKTNI